MDAAHVVALWLHGIAMVIVLGWYVALGRVVLPALSRSLDGATLARAVSGMAGRARPLVLLAIVVFIATGAWLLATDSRYAGVGNLSTTWSSLMLAKHVVVVVMVVLGVVVDRLAASVREVRDDAVAREVGILGLATDGMTSLGAIVLLLTAAAQAS
jgi:uncharacterized membrane protein